MEAWTPREEKILRSLSTPQKIQDFLEKIPANFEKSADTCLSPRRVLRERKAQCLEGAMLAAAALRFHGRLALLLDLTSAPHDDDHVVALFKERGFFGAISKTNHAVLRYREPIYRTMRELALSYFHEYFLDDGEKTMRSYAGPLDLKKFDKRGWMTAEEDLWYIRDWLFAVKHTPLLHRSQIRGLRKADMIERKAGKLLVWKKSRHLRG